MYRDYAISRPSSTGSAGQPTSDAATDQPRTCEHAERGPHILLFARESAKGGLGTPPLLFLGPADYVSHEGSRPVAFRWRLGRPMPTDFYETARMVAG